MVVDGAHNPDGIEALLEALPRVFGTTRPRLLFSALSDKPWWAMAARLSPHVSGVTVTGLSGPRSVAPEELASAFPVPVHVDPDPGHAFRAMIERPGDGPVLVAGSLYLAGSVYRCVLGREGMDSVFDRIPGATA